MIACRGPSITGQTTEFGDKQLFFDYIFSLSHFSCTILLVKVCRLGILNLLFSLLTKWTKTGSFTVFRGRLN